MEIVLKRYSSGDDSTLGVMTWKDNVCFTCEDEFRTEKVAGETRIPAGRYEIKLRNSGGMTKKYAARYPFHRGMLHLQDVPGFQYIYIHTGNNDDHTEGCILVGYGAELERLYGGGTISRSRQAYSDLYMDILDAMNRNDPVYIHVLD